MTKFVLASIAFVALAAAAVATAAASWAAVSMGEPVTVRVVVITIVAAVFPPLLVYVFWFARRSSRQRVENASQLEKAMPDALVFSALSTPEFVADVNRLRGEVGFKAVTDNHMPFTVTVLGTQIGLWRGGARPELVLTIGTDQVRSIETQSTTTRIAGPRGSHALVAVHCLDVHVDWSGRETRIAIPPIFRDAERATPDQVRELADLVTVKLETRTRR